jgi:hypothetical protein
MGESRFKRILARRSINIKDKISQGSPLTKRIVEALLMGSVKVFQEDFEKSKDLDLRWLIPSELNNQVERFHRFLPDKKLNFTKVSIDLFLEYFSKDIICSQDMLSYRLWKLLSKKNHHEYMEYLSKSIAENDLQVGEVIPAPYSSTLQEYYRVFKTIYAQGLVAYALKPISSFSFSKPLLVFRPTVLKPSQSDAFYTLLNDLEDRLGSMGYQAARDELTELLNDTEFKSPDAKIDVLGYSLGGNHAQRFLFDHYSQVSSLYTVNAPSVESALAEDFADRINNLPHSSEDAKFKIIALRVKDDLAHFVGQKHLGLGINHPLSKREFLQLDFTRSSSSEKKFFVIDKMERHLDVFLSQPDASFVAERHLAEEFDRNLDNTNNSDAVFWENLRTTVGSKIALPILKIFNAIFLFCHTYLHFSPFTYSAPRYKYPWME